MKTTVLLPTLNEAENISPLINSITEILPETEILVVDGKSSDGTVKEIKKLSKRFPIKLIKEKKGLGTALISGLKAALLSESDTIIQMDADLSHSPHHIPSLLLALKNSDIALGSRETFSGFSKKRKLISYGANFLAGKLLQLPKDSTSGFRAYRKEALEKINLDSFLSEGFSFQIEMLFEAKKRGLKIAEVPINFPKRESGRSKLSFKEMTEFLSVVLKLAVRR